MLRRISCFCLAAFLGSAAAFAAERTVSSYVPANAWLVISYDGAHPGFAETPLARFLAEPEVQDALKQWQPLLDKAFEEANRDAGFDIAPVLRAASGCEMALAFLPPLPEKDHPAGLILARVGAGDAAARQHAEKLMKLMVGKAKPDTVRQVQVGELQATCFIEQGGDPVAFAFDGPFLVMAEGEDLLRRALDPAAPKLAARAGEERAVFRIRYSHVAMLEAFGAKVGPEAKKVLDAMGISGVAGAELSLVPRGKRLAASFSLDMPDAAKRAGPLKGLADATPYDPEMLKFVPKDAAYFWLGNLDYAWLWDEVWAAIARVNPQAAEAARKELTALENKAGVKLRDGLLAPLGRGTLLVGKSEGLLGGGAVLVQRVRDADALDKAFAQLVARLDLLLMGNPDLQLGAVRTDLKTFQYRGHSCRYLWMMGLPVLALPGTVPCYTRIGDCVAFAANPLQMKAFLDFLEDKEPAIQENAEFRDLAAAVPKGATSIGYAAWGDVAQSLYNTAMPILSLLQGEPAFKGKLDVANMPSSRLIRRYAGGTIAYTAFENGRFRAETEGNGLDVGGTHLFVVGGAGAMAAILFARAEMRAELDIQVPEPAPKEAPPRAVQGGVKLQVDIRPPAYERGLTEAKLIRNRNNLNQIAKGCAVYLNEHGDNRWFPKSLGELLDKKIIEDKAVFVSPLDDGPPKLANGLPCSYVSCFDKYPDHRFRDDFAPDTIMAWDRKPFVEGKRGLLFMDSHVEYVDEERFKKELQKLAEAVQRAINAQPPDKGDKPKAPAQKGTF